MEVRELRRTGVLILALLAVGVFIAQSRRECEVPGSSYVPCFFGSSTHGTKMDDRGFPAPWSAEQIPGGYVVKDATGQSLAYVYARETKQEADTAHVLTMDEARRIAANIAKLPTLLSKPKHSPAT